MVIDNFQIVRERLDFYEPYDRFVIHVLKRGKDGMVLPCANI